MSWTLYGTSHYAILKDIDPIELASMNGQTLFEHITNKFGWTPSEGTDFENQSINCNSGFIQAVDKDRNPIEYDIYYDGSINEYVAVIKKD